MLWCTLTLHYECQYFFKIYHSLNSNITSILGEAQGQFSFMPKSHIDIFLHSLRDPTGRAFSGCLCLLLVTCEGIFSITSSHLWNALPREACLQGANQNIFIRNVSWLLYVFSRFVLLSFYVLFQLCLHTTLGVPFLSQKSSQGKKLSLPLLREGRIDFTQ